MIPGYYVPHPFIHYPPFSSPLPHLPHLLGLPDLGNKTQDDWGACVAQPGKHPTLGFSSGHNLRVIGSSPTLGFMFNPESA